MNAKAARRVWHEFQQNEERAQEDVKSWVLERNFIKSNFARRERMLKEHFLFRIEAMEAAMHEIKLRSQQSVERAEMALNDFESQFIALQTDDE